MIIPVALNTTIRLFYTAQGLATGQSVVFNLWDDDGTQVVTSAAADGEVLSEGLYYYDYTTPSSDTYVVGFGSLASGNSTATIGPFVLKVGNPTPQKMFYFDILATATPTYRVYDISGVDQQTGALTAIGSTGFYSADVTVTSKQQYFFEVADNNLVTSFELEAFLHEGTGGVDTGGSAETHVALFYDGTGGIIMGGSAETVFSPNVQEHVGTGGAVTGGSAETRMTLYHTGTGGVATGGSSENNMSLPHDATGGIVIGGSAEVLFSINYEGTGGILLSGSADTRMTLYYTGSGGVTMGGAAEGGQSNTHVATGGIIIGGSAEVLYIPGVQTHEATGGATTGGSAETRVTFYHTATGGISTGGSSENNIGANFYGAGGVVIGGSAEFAYVPHFEGAGGVAVGGSAETRVTFYYTATGGIIIGGSIEGGQVGVYFMTGGFSLGGSAEVLFSVSHTGRPSAHQIKIGGSAEVGFRARFVTEEEEIYDYSTAEDQAIHQLLLAQRMLKRMAGITPIIGSPGEIMESSTTDANESRMYWQRMLARAMVSIAKIEQSQSLSAFALSDGGVVEETVSSDTSRNNWVQRAANAAKQLAALGQSSVFVGKPGEVLETISSIGSNYNKKLIDAQNKLFSLPEKLPDGLGGISLESVSTQPEKTKVVIAGAALAKLAMMSKTTGETGSVVETVSSSTTSEAQKAQAAINRIKELQANKEIGRLP